MALLHSCEIQPELLVLPLRQPQANSPTRSTPALDPATVMRVNDQIEVYFADSRNWYDAVVDTVDDDGSCHLKFGDGHEGWYTVEGATVKQMLDLGKFSRKLKWRPAGQPATKPAKRPLPASPSEEPAEEPEPQQRRKQKAAAAPKRPEQVVEAVGMVDAEPEADDGRPRRAAAKRGVAYMRSSLEEIDRDSMDGLSSEDEDSAPRKRAPTKRGKATKQAKKVDDDGSDFEDDDGDEEEEEADEDAEGSGDDYTDDDEEERKGRAKQKKAGRAPAKGKASTKAPAKAKAKARAPDDGEWVGAKPKPPKAAGGSKAPTPWIAEGAAEAGRAAVCRRGGAGHRGPRCRVDRREAVREARAAAA